MTFPVLLPLSLAPLLGASVGFIVGLIAFLVASRLLDEQARPDGAGRRGAVGSRR
jgi:hypothetical protein